MKYPSTIPFRILFILAWLLFSICMVLPIGGIGQGTYLSEGAGFVLLGVEVAWYAILSPLFVFIWPITELTLLALGIFMSDLLFIASPFILARSKSDRLLANYVSLNIICVIILAIPVAQIDSHIDPVNRDIQYLPGLAVWLAAQIALTLAAGLQWFQRSSQQDNNPNDVKYRV